MNPTRGGGNRWLALVTAVLIAVLLAVATVSLWFRATVVDEEVFVGHAVEILASELGRQALAEEIVARVIELEPLFVVVRAPLERALAGVLASEAFDPLYRLAAERLHATLVGDAGDVVIDLEPWRDVILEPIAAVSPDLAASVPDAVFAPIVLVEVSQVPTMPVAATSPVLPLIGLAATAVLLTAVARRSVLQAMVALGAGVVGAAVLVVVGVARRSAVLSSIDPGPTKELADLLVASLVGSLRRVALFELLVGGLVLAAAGAVLAVRHAREGRAVAPSPP